MDKSLLIKLINIYCINNISRINTTSDIVNELSRIFNNPNFLENVQNSRYNWIEENTNIVLKTSLANEQKNKSKLVQFVQSLLLFLYTSILK